MHASWNYTALKLFNVLCASEFVEVLSKITFQSSCVLSVYFVFSVGVSKVAALEQDCTLQKAPINVMV